MRPPVLPSGNPPRRRAPQGHPAPGFNEAAGFTQRKPEQGRPAPAERRDASMRPPVLPSGNERINFDEEVA